MDDERELQRNQERDIRLAGRFVYGMALVFGVPALFFLALWLKLI